jgi:membrane-associated phospholipid phosphatase
MVPGRAGRREPICGGNGAHRAGDGLSSRNVDRVPMRHGGGMVTDRPLIARRALALWVAAGCWVAVALIGVHYAGDTNYGPVDGSLTRALSTVVGNPKPMGKWAVIGPTVPTRILGTFSNTFLIYGVVAVVAAYALWRRRWAAAGLAVLAPAVCALVTEVSKPWFDRYHDGYLAYPSGHMATSAAALTVGVLVLRRRRPAWAPWALWALWATLWALWAVVIGATAAGLVALNYHYPSDTAGGLLLAWGVVLPGAVLADRFTRPGRRRPGQPDRPDQVVAPVGPGHRST